MSEDAPYSPERLETGRVLFAQDCTFLLGAAGLGQIPESILPEVAFAGRSNVGKSSLINALTGRNSLARTSNTPGRTQQINFFDLGQRLMIADLPGHGYAKAPKEEVAKWTRLVNTYLKGRQPLRRVMMLIDSRHGIKKVDVEVMNMLDKAAVPYQIVLTKTDKVSAKQLEKLKAKTAEDMKKRPAAFPLILATSSAKSIGIEELRAELSIVAEQ